jgi:hypothetical protein
VSLNTITLLTSHVFLRIESAPLSGTSFTNSYHEWTFENFKDWSLKQFGHKERDSDDEAPVPVQFQKAKDIIFEKDKKGHFVLPTMSNFRTNKQRQRVIRGYIGAVYRAQYHFFIFFWHF